MINITNTYKSNTEPKIGDRVTSPHNSENPETIFKVVSVLGGRMGNKVGICFDGPGMYVVQEVYYYCLCPQN